MSDIETTGEHKLLRHYDADSRPRERLIKYGPKELTDAELMAIIFNTGIRGKSVLELSQDIIADNGGNMAQVANMSVAQMLDRYKGIGPAKAVTLQAALELGQRVDRDRHRFGDKQIRMAQDVYDAISWRLADLDYEEFWVLYLSQSARIKREIRIGQGGVAATVVDVRIIMREALASLASSMILVHNHPSGALTPSGQDDTITRKISEAAKLFDIRVLDHVIISYKGYYSYANEGRL